MTDHTVKIICAADGSETPHDGRWLVRWNPHTRFGIVDCTSTANRAKARRGTFMELLTEWKMLSNVQPTRPTDGKPNRPLCALTIEIEKIDD